MQETLTFLAFYQHIKHLSLALASYFANSTIYSRENNEFSKYLLVRSEFRKSRFTVTVIGVQFIVSNTASTVLTRSAFAWRL